MKWQRRYGAAILQFNRPELLDTLVTVQFFPWESVQMFTNEEKYSCPDFGGPNRVNLSPALFR